MKLQGTHAARTVKFTAQYVDLLSVYVLHAQFVPLRVDQAVYSSMAWHR